MALEPTEPDSRESGGMDSPSPLPVVVLVYDGVAADETGTVVQILTAADLEVIVASVSAAQVTSFHGRVAATRTVEDLKHCSALITPGGMGVQSVVQIRPLLDAIEVLAQSATWLGATSTGSVLLAAAGVVDGARATTHWLAGDLITSRGLTLVREPFVEDGRLLTAGGVASAATLAYRLVAALAGIEAEAEVRALFRVQAATDRRYRRRLSIWRLIGRKRPSPSHHPLDPSGKAEIVTLDLDS